MCRPDFLPRAPAPISRRIRTCTPIDQAQIGRYLKPEVTQYIVETGLYLDSESLTKRTSRNAVTAIVQKAGKRLGNSVRNAMKQVIHSLGLWDRVREAKVRRVANSEMRQVTLNGSTFRTKRYVGSGLNSDAFIIEIDGTDYLIKIANGRPHSPSSLRRSVGIQKWLGARSGLNVPGLLEFDPEGKWVINEYIRGPSLVDAFQEPGPLAPATREKLRKFFEAAREFERKSHVRLDLRADNVILRNGEPVLVDLGPLPKGSQKAASFEEQWTFWKREAAASGRGGAVPACFSRLLFRGQAVRLPR